MTVSDAAGVPKTKDVVPPTFDVVGLDHSENPFELSSARRWACTLMVIRMTATIAFCSSIHTAATTSVAEDFNYSRTVSTLGVSTFLFGFASGPLISAPLSELYGHNPIYRITLFLFVAFSLGCALAPTIAALLVFRFLGSSDPQQFSVPIFWCVAVYTDDSSHKLGGSLNDLWPPTHRSVPLALFTAASFLGPVLSPIVGGFISQLMTWRW
ncbi:hypothetical protein SUNI508_11034 [Seiridium unicorne]|uniref:Major facilitator superfamily (MFS) profile domain-containing protein n=1 Tax=Seiridium unicorne TaxID=138068 RepID=A0ABR2UJQ9_9PEZI